MPKRLGEIINFDQHAMELTFPQKERLGILVEELGEALHMAGKILRHGYNNYHPNEPEIKNKVNLARELGHVLFAIDFLCAHEDIDRIIVEDSRQKKLVDVEKFLHFHANPFHAVTDGGKNVQ